MLLMLNHPTGKADDKKRKRIESASHPGRLSPGNLQRVKVIEFCLRSKPALRGSKSHASQKGATYADHYSATVDASGFLPEGIMNDGLHPNAQGYAAYGRGRERRDRAGA